VGSLFSFSSLGLQSPKKSLNEKTCSAFFPFGWFYQETDPVYSLHTLTNKYIYIYFFASEGAATASAFLS